MAGCRAAKEDVDEDDLEERDEAWRRPPRRPWPERRERWWPLRDERDATERVSVLDERESAVAEYDDDDVREDAEGVEAERRRRASLRLRCR